MIRLRPRSQAGHPHLLRYPPTRDIIAGGEMIRRSLTVIAWTIIAPLCGSAQATPKAEIVDFGLTAGRRAESGETAGQSSLSPAQTMTNLRYIERTDRIEARLCRNFGLTVRLIDSVAKALPRRVIVRVLHPLLTAPDGRTSIEDRFPSEVVDGTSHVGFTFEHEWEMQPGEWVFVISSAGSEIARKAFTITLPAPGAANSDCGVG
jgi:hypothetical protein